MGDLTPYLDDDEDLRSNPVQGGEDGAGAQLQSTNSQVKDTDSLPESDFQGQRSVKHPDSSYETEMEGSPRVSKELNLSCIQSPHISSTLQLQFFEPSSIQAFITWEGEE